MGEDGVPAAVVNDLLQDLDAVERKVAATPRCSSGGCTVGTATSGWCADPDDEALKASCAELWAREMRDEGVRHALKDTDAMDGPAHVRDNQLFWLGDEGRVGMVKDEQRRYGILEGRATCLVEPAQGWDAWAAHEAAVASRVLLRRCTRKCSWKACVILGPGEWKYWHQLPQAFDAHGVLFPARLRDHGLVMSPN